MYTLKKGVMVLAVVFIMLLSGFFWTESDVCDG